MDFDAPWRCRSVNHFERLKFIGEGTYGVVYKVRDKVTKEVFAMKKIKMDREKEGFPITALREIKLLKLVDHVNIVKLREIVTSQSKDDRHPGTVYLLFEYAEYDLEALLTSKAPVIHFTVSELKCLIKQMLQSLEYLHSKRILHRDLKCANLLVNNRGQIKLADFGLARTLSKNPRDTCTTKVITLWYRPPELLLGGTRYAYEVDMWSAGCIIGELLGRAPMFPENEEQRVLNKIWKLCGTPTEENWPGHQSLPLYEALAPREQSPRTLRVVYANSENYPNFDSLAIDLIDKLLVLDPRERLTATQALAHPYFTTDPLPCDPSNLPKPDMELHEKDVRSQRTRRREAPEALPAIRPPSNSLDSPTRRRNI